jgi:hypothetical protein
MKVASRRLNLLLLARKAGFIVATLATRCGDDNHSQLVSKYSLEMSLRFFASRLALTRVARSLWQSWGRTWGVSGNSPGVFGLRGVIVDGCRMNGKVMTLR